MAPARKRLRDMNVDEFLNADLDNESDSSSSKCEIPDLPRSKKARSGLQPVNVKSPSNDGQETAATPKKKVKSKNKGNISNGKKQGDNSNSLASTLKDADPEFYDFLKGQDKSLLDNLKDLSDTDNSDDDGGSEASDAEESKKSAKNGFEKELLKMSSGEDTDSESEGSGIVHKLPGKLEVASDDSTDEDDEAAELKDVKKKGGILLTHKVIDKWTLDVKKQPSQFLFKEMVSAFHAAVQEAEGAGQTQVLKYRVEGGAVFNSVVRLCLTQIVPTLEYILQLPNLAELQQDKLDKIQVWKKLKMQVKCYISDLLRLLEQLSEAVMINAIMKHIHKLIIFYASFGKLTKLFLKRMIKMWTTGEETTRVLAFLCINKVVRMKQDELLEICLKQMYVAYVSNCKFTSPATLPLINFMQRSLVELLNIDQTVAYQYAFVYLRQLAIHLRNAISVKKKETCQTVYNWQYIHCLGLWVQLLSVTHPSEILQPLIYPLTQTIIGTIKLVPTARYYPLRFHCVQLLNQLACKTNTFIPTLPFLLEIFEQTDFNRKHKNISLKPFNFAVILKFSKTQLGEKAFKDGLIDQLYEHLLESFNIQAHSIGFPEFIILSVVQLKTFLKKCKIANYCKQIKQIVDKIQEHSKFVAEKRKRSSINLTDFQAVHLWESELAASDTPLRKYYASWRKLRDRELQHLAANKEAISGAAIDIPTIDRKKPIKATPQEREDFSKLFENDSESDDETRFLLKEERVKTGKEKQSVGSESDDYSDFDDDELEQLAQSGSSGEEEDVEMDNDEEEDDDSVDEDDEISAKKPVKKNKTLRTSQKVSAVKPAQKENVADEDDVVEDFVLSDFESD
ncbi:unnamed protein product [Candidula unifasciata]|uniref:Nucleolar complex protein 2 homolog n=1 Tax=Candidula unifasciata TaxID=100452 RepID=A0A8S3YL23_9EUPU|nr:unnamed protein product [Candidula unifasciata]